MRTLFLAVACAGLLHGQDAHDIILRSISHAESEWKKARDYNFQQRVEERKLDGGNKVKSVETKTFDVSVFYGIPYSKLIQKDDKPIPASEQRQENEKQSKQVAKWKAEVENGHSPADKDFEERKKVLREVPAAFHFTLVGEEQMGGRPMYVIQADPNPAYQPKTSASKVLTKLNGKLWVDKQDYEWARVDVEVTQPLNFGLVIARLSPGARISVVHARINGEVWLPQYEHIRFDARVALVKRMNEEIEVTFKNYRKFQSDSRVIIPEKVP